MAKGEANDKVFDSVAVSNLQELIFAIDIKLKIEKCAWKSLQDLMESCSTGTGPLAYFILPTFVRTLPKFYYSFTL